MLLLAAGLLALALAAVGIAYAVVHGLRLWRATKRLSREAAPSLERISAATAQIEVQIRQAQEAGARLQAVVADLRRSRAQLDVPLQAVNVARQQVRRVLWFVPGM